MASTESWYIPCVPDNEEFKPTPDELEMMYAKLEKGDTINLEWKFPGRRPPTPVQITNAEHKKNANSEQYVYFQYFIALKRKYFSSSSERK